MKNKGLSMQSVKPTNGETPDRTIRRASDLANSSGKSVEVHINDIKIIVDKDIDPVSYFIKYCKLAAHKQSGTIMITNQGKRR